MKKLLTLLILSFHLTIFSQQILTDLSAYQSTTLANGLTVITVKTNASKYLTYSLILETNEKTYQKNIGSIDIFCHIAGCELSDKTLLTKNMISDNNAVDSVLIFLKNKVLTPNFDAEDVKATKEYYKKLLGYQKNKKSELVQTTRILSYGKNSPFASFPTAEDIDGVSIEALDNVRNEVVNLRNAHLVVVGNVEHDTVVKYANLRLHTQMPQKSSISHSTPADLEKTIVNFLAKNTTTKLAVNYPVKNFYKDNDFFAKQIVTQIFNNKICSGLPQYSQNIDLSVKPQVAAAEFMMNFDISTDETHFVISKINEIMNEMLLFEPSETLVNKAKTDLETAFNMSLKNPYQIAFYAYIMQKYNLPNNFFENYVNSLKSVSLNDTKTATPTIIKPENANFVIFGQKDKLLCQLYYVADFFEVNFNDTSFVRYKIIPQGFNANYLIDRFLNTCNMLNDVENLSVEFEADYTADTTYKVIGRIYKKMPDFYYYKTELLVEDDTLLQSLQIGNKKQNLDSTAMGSVFLKKEEFLKKIYRNYIFRELYYNELGYSPIFVCDTALMNKNIYKIKVTTSENLYFYDYYDLTKNEKIKTEVFVTVNGIDESIQSVEYYDYKRVKGSKILMPYTITQTVGDIKFVMRIKKIDTRTILSNKIFRIKKAPARPPSN